MSSGSLVHVERINWCHRTCYEGTTPPFEHRRGILYPCTLSRLLTKLVHSHRVVVGRVLPGLFVSVYYSISGLLLQIYPSMSSMLHLPDGVWTVILQHSGFAATTRFRETSKHFRALVDSQPGSFWRAMWMWSGPHDDLYPQGTRTGEDWAPNASGVLTHLPATCADSLEDRAILLQAFPDIGVSLSRPYERHLVLPTPWDEPTYEVWPLPRTSWASWREKLRWYCGCHSL